ncbi:MAG: peptidoglycan-binding protein [Desulfuromonadales bacterium]|nr:MAG: peptidoglycan-binding protein [Desulfuromonadales bacterium]
MKKRITRSLLTIIALAISMPMAGNALAAPASFELDVKDLETAKPPAKPRRQPARTQRRDAVTHKETPQAEPSGEGIEKVTRYTVKPGDFLFKILIRDFGLSNAQAEAMIPGIQKLNKLPSATRLEVGQTILIPLARRSSGVMATAKAAPGSDANRPAEEPAPKVAPSPPAEVPQTSVAQPVSKPLPRTPAEETVATTAPKPPVAEEPQRSVPPPRPVPVAAELSFSTALLRLWEELIPGQAGVEPLTLNGKVLDPVNYPVLLAADGGKILIDLRGTLTPQTRNQLTQKFPDLRIVSRGEDRVKSFISSLVKMAEFARADENVSVDFGADPKLTVRADFKIARVPTTQRGPETVLLFLDDNGPCLPPHLRNYLTNKGYQVAEFCSATSSTFAEPGYDLRAIPSSSPCDMTISLLDALSIKLDRNRIVSGAMGSGTENRFSIRVEGYFEAGGKRFILNCSENDSYNYTLFRLLQLQGYGLVEPRDTDDFAAVTDRLLTELTYPHTFGRHELDYGKYRIGVTGFKVTRRDTSSGRLLITSRPSDPVFAHLLLLEPPAK